MSTMVKLNVMHVIVLVLLAGFTMIYFSKSLVGLVESTTRTSITHHALTGTTTAAAGKSATSGQIFTMTVVPKRSMGSSNNGKLLFQQPTTKDSSNSNLLEKESRKNLKTVGMTAVTSSTTTTTTKKTEGVTHNGSTETWPTDKFWNPKGCKHWATLTTIFPVTDAAAEVSRLPGWCLVVAGDRKGPESYLVNDNDHDDTAATTVIFLSAERQEELQHHLSFVARTPWNHFARKNIAFLFAIANGAEFIWDFDDDNALLAGQDLSRFTKSVSSSVSSSSSETTTTTSISTTKVLQVNNVNTDTTCNSFNPYDFFQPTTSDRIWPRGYPLEDIRDPNCQLEPSYCRRRVATESIGIYQSIANKDPDVDAIYRLIHDLPVNFKGAYQDEPVVIPPHTLSPMNAQAALFRRSAFWSLYLPTTVHGRVSDIWRSYIAQALGHQYGMLATFIGPLVRQDRNVHNYLADLQSEEPLYERAGALVKYLLEWNYDTVGGTFEGAMERLYVDLYEHDILEWEDVVMVQLWLKALQSIGYEFPNLFSGDLPPSAVLEVECIHSYNIPIGSEKIEKESSTMTDV